LTPVDTTTLTKATASVTPKTGQGKTQGLTAEGTATSTAATEATADATQNAATPQTPTTGKQETATAAVQGTPADAAAQAPAAAARDRTVASATHAAAAADVADTNTQAIGGTFQPQFNSTSALNSTSNLTVTSAAGGTVPLSGVALEIAANVKSGKSSFDIRLDPADLGRIDVRVQIDQNGQVTSHLTVEKPETLSMLRQDAPQLQQALNDAGLKTDSGGLQFSLRDQSSGQNSGNDSNPNAQQLIVSDEDAVPAAVAGRSYGRSLGSSTGVDIRV
jgi:flagellar hook-length control protein FliK